MNINEDENFNIKKKDGLMIFTFLTLALSLVSTFTYMIYTFATSSSLLNHIVSIISVIVLVIFSIFLVVTGFFIENKKAKIFISIASLILAFYSIFQVVIGINTPKDFVLDFTNYDIKDVVSWASTRNIEIKQGFEYSDKVDEFHIIKQDVEAGIPTKKVNVINVTVSNGIDPSKKTEVTNMVGWDLDDVIKFIDDNLLTNVTIKFEFSNTTPKDKIISQNLIREISRNEPVTLTSSLGKESAFGSVTLDNLVGMDVFHATTYLGRNNLKYSFVYAYSDKKEGTVLKQSLKKWTVISPNSKEEIILTIAKQNEVTIPDLSKMDRNGIIDWATENRIKFEFTEEYDDTIKKDKVIAFLPSAGSIVPIGTNLNVTLSKGSIKMIEFTNIDDFRKWAQEYGVIYNVKYEFSDTVNQGKLISSNYAKGQIIKNNDTVNLVISEGGSTKVPNFIDLTKEQAEAKCKDAKITCKFVYLDNNISYTLISKQSMRSESIVPNNTTITLTIGKLNEEKVDE